MAADCRGGDVAATGVPVLRAQSARRIANVERDVRGRVFALAILAGHHAVPMFAIVALGGLGLAAVVGRRATWDAAAIRTGLMLLVAMAGAAVQILPTLEYGHYALRWVNTATPVNDRMAVPYPAHEALALKASELPFLVLPGSDAIVDPLVGIVPLALAAVALLSRPRRAGAGVAAGVALAALLFSMVRLNPLHGVLYAIVPGLEKARAPIMAMAVADIGLAALVAFGIEDLLKRAGGRLSLIYRSVAVIGVGLFVMSLYPPALFKAVPDAAERIAGVAVVAILLAVLLYAWDRGLAGPRITVGVLLALGLFEGYNSSGSQYTHVEDAASIVRPRLYGGMSDAVKFLREHAGIARVNYAYEDLIFNFGDWYGIQTVSGFVPSAPEAVWKLGLWNARVLDLYGARYHLGRKAPEGAGPEVFASAQGWKIWERPTAFPRAWVAHKITVAKDRDEAYRAVLAVQTNLREEAILERPVSVEACQDSAR